MADAEYGYRYWRYVEAPDAEPISTELEILRRIDPAGGKPSGLPDGFDLEVPWRAAAESIVTEHNSRINLRESTSERIGPKQSGRSPSSAIPLSASRAKRAPSAPAKPSRYRFPQPSAVVSAKCKPPNRRAL